MLVIDTFEELKLIFRMIDTLKNREYTIPELSSVLGFSMYSGHFYKLPLFKKLLMERVFVISKNSKPAYYSFDIDRMKDVLSECEVWVKFKKIMGVRVSDW